MIPSEFTHAALAVFFLVSTVFHTSCCDSYKKEGDKVKVSLYDETLCPACREFVKDQLGPTWKNLKPIMDVELVAYGWAEETPKGKGYNFTCQHGPDECVGNMILECAKAHTSDLDSFLNFAVCFMSQKSPLPPPLKVGKRCAKSLHIKWLPIKRCSHSLEGQKLLHDAGVKFHALKNPEPQWVPWILIDGIPNDDAELNLRKVVCSTYKGTPPIGCQPKGKSIGTFKKKVVI